MTSMDPRILVIDDEENMLLMFRQILEKEQYEVETAPDGPRGLQIASDHAVDLVISDLSMPGMDGIEVLKRMKLIQPDAPFIVLTGFGTIESAVEAMKLGAYDYMTKPIHREQLLVTVRKAFDYLQLKREVVWLKEAAVETMSFSNIIGKSKKMKELFRLIRRVANSSTSILLQGESGTGKELFAKAIHYNSPRKDRLFIPVDCGSIPETLLESELFGHTRGAFTGAVASRRGLFEEANGGTLFLDEVGNMSLAFQAKLLRAIQEGEVRPVGSSDRVTVDVRIVGATNKNLKLEVEKGNFREDLFYRLAVVPITIPSLRERKEDIPLLAKFFLEKYSRSTPPPQLTPEALGILLNYSWPGNVRELENLMERAALLCEGALVMPAHLSFDEARDIVPARDGVVPLREATEKTVKIIEKEKILHALAAAGGNKARAAKMLGISRGTLYNKLKELDIRE